MTDAIKRCYAEETAACCWQLTVDLTFSCQAEVMIFQLGLR
ncbi:DUF406 family protein [Xenorhabdus budapestensis]|uniref:DUF406 family protein n=1 Tax=Xenorhabdus budapestensis TaxID=290110 RepID=A0A2D0IX91_XENBU|nr:DUF406 family protein [Xenorhabdus budapestensis]PHM26566.1 hypothetical protein Xbud_02594 [Xenorhabdus budapestensis]QTL41126.1 DUF406 family protein [Xenorhabdus budapestensis]